MPATYDSIATQTLGSTAATVTFSSIPSTFTDLILISSVKFATGGANGTFHFQFNGDTATNYSFTYIQGNGSSVISGRGANATIGVLGQGGNSSGNEFGIGIAQIQNYSNTTTNKTVLTRANESSAVVQTWVSTWRNSNAINSILISGAYSFAAGSTFTLYGIKAAQTMPLTYQVIGSVTVGAGGAASINFTSIPSTFTDLVLKVSARNNNTGLRVRFNSDSGTNYSWRRLSGNAAAGFSDSNSTYGSPYNTFLYFSMQNITSDTANTFSNGEMYVFNYAGSAQKSASLDSVQENNATNSNMAMQAGLWTGTAAITSIALTPDTDTSPSIAQHSTATLYGIKKDQGEK